MWARFLQFTLLSLGLVLASGGGAKQARESELSAALTKQVHLLNALDERVRDRMTKPFTEHKRALDGTPLATDPLVSFLNMADVLLMGTQSATLIEVLAAAHVQMKCEDDRILIASIAKKELDASISAVAHAADLLEAESEVPRDDSDVTRIGVEGAAALREIFKISCQLQLKVFPDK